MISEMIVFIKKDSNIFITKFLFIFTYTHGPNEENLIHN